MTDLEELNRQLREQNTQLDAECARLEAENLFLTQEFTNTTDATCKFPICHNKDYQEALAAQLTAELVTGIVEPPGYILVPIEMMPEMIAAAEGCWDHWGNGHVVTEMWPAIIAAVKQQRKKQ